MSTVLKMWLPIASPLNYVMLPKLPPIIVIMRISTSAVFIWRWQLASRLGSMINGILVLLESRLPARADRTKEPNGSG